MACPALPQGAFIPGRRRLPGFVLFLLVLSLASASQALAAFSMSKTTSGTILVGETDTVTLTASNLPKSSPTTYNLSFRDVLPPGVSFAGGTAPTTTIPNEPSPGFTTLIWDNVADLPGGANYSISFTVAHATAGPGTFYDAGESYTNTGGAYANTDPRTLPAFDGRGRPQTGTYTNSATGSAVTKLEAIEITKGEPSPEGEILRGLHNHPTTYTLTVRNNLVAPTTGVVVDDYLPANLEFLGCTTAADPTTDHSGGTEEYPGSGAIPNAATCADPLVHPALVETVTLDPDGTGPAPSGVYTHVQWSAAQVAGLAALSTAPGNEVKISYQAAVPLRRNVMFAAPVPATTGAQGGNVRNNTGAQILDEEPITNWAKAAGTYASTKSGSVPVSDFGSLARSAEDLRILKKVTPTTVAQGQISTWTLDVQTSEYRYYDDLVLTDTLPDGLCPIHSPTLDLGGSAANRAECEGTPTNTIQSSTTSPGAVPSAGGQDLDAATPIDYTSALENTNGSWTLKFDKTGTGLASLSHLHVSDRRLISFQTKTRIAYQEASADQTSGGQPAEISANDRWTNDVTMTALAHARCTPSGALSAAQSEASCADANRVTPGVEGTSNTDASSASQSSPGPVIVKEVGTRATTDAGGCAAATYARDPDPLEGFRPGDTVCWHIYVDFPKDLSAVNVRIEDFLPAGYAYVDHGAMSPNTLTPLPAIDTTGADLISGGGRVAWFTPLVNTGPKRFDVWVETYLANASAGTAVDVPGNLAKLRYENSLGEIFFSRDKQDVAWDEPQLRLLKGVATVSPAPDANGPNAPNIEGQTVRGGSVVTYRIDLWNNGDVEAGNTEVWDRLPAGISCADVTGGATPTTTLDGAALPAGITVTCAAGIIKWSANADPGLTVPAATGADVGSSATPVTATNRTLRYTVTMPGTISPEQTLTNTAGIRSYTSTTDNGSSLFTYYPASNIDPTAPTSPLTQADAASDTAYVVTPSTAFAKDRTTSIDETANAAANQATIGERIDYTVTFTIPQRTRIYDATLSDAIQAQQTLDQGSIEVALSAGCTGAAYAASTTMPSDFSSTSDATTVGIEIGTGSPRVYTTTGPGDCVVTLTYSTVVADVAANLRSGTVDNTAKVTWNDQGGTAHPAAASTSTTIVEPSIAIAKAADTLVRLPGEDVNYSLTVSNATGTNVSVAHETVVVDRVPAGMTPYVWTGTAYLGLAADGDVVSPQGGIWNAAARTITWTPTGVPPATTAALATLARGDSTALDYRVQLETPMLIPAPLVNRAQADTSSIAGDAPGERKGTDYPGGGSAALGAVGTGYEAIANVTITIPAPSLQKSVTPTTGTPGEILTYTLTATIQPGTFANDLIVYDLAPDGVTVDTLNAAVCTTGASGNPPCPGAFDLVADPLGTQTENASGQTPLAWDIHTQPRPAPQDMTAYGTATRIVTITYTAHVDATYHDGSPVKAGDALTNTARLHWTNDPAGSKGIAASAGGAIPPESSYATLGFGDTVSPDVSATVDVVEPRIVLDKDVRRLTPAENGCGPISATTDGGSDATADACAVEPGDTFEYSLRIENAGTSPAYDLVVKDQPDTGLVNVSPVAPSGTFAPAATTPATNLTCPATQSTTNTDPWASGDRAMAWTVSCLEPGQVVTFTYQADLDGSSALTDGMTIANTLEVPQFFGFDAAYRAAHPFAFVEYGDATDARYPVADDIDTLTVDTPTLGIAKTDGADSESGTATVGQPFQWKIVVTNTASYALTAGADVVDTLPANWQFLSDAGHLPSISVADDGNAPTAGLTTAADTLPAITTAATGDTLTWTDIADLGPGDSVTITFWSKPLNDAIVDAGLQTDAHVNDAKATAEDRSGASGDANGPYASPVDTAAATLVVTTDPLRIAKTRTTSITATGNDADAQATIGEEITYTVSVTIPEGTTVFDGRLSDVFDGTRQALVAVDSATLTDGADAPVDLPTAGIGGPDTSGVTGSATDTIAIVFPQAPAPPAPTPLPQTYTNPVGSGDDVVTLVYRVRVRDVPANVAADAVSNTATVDYADQNGTAASASAGTTTTIVEPSLTIAKSSTFSGPVNANDVPIPYVLTVTNASGTSPAYRLSVSDVVPVGLTPVDAANAPLADGDTTPNGGVWNLATRTITWDDAAIAAIQGHAAPSQLDADGTLEITYSAKAGASLLPNPLVNTASVRSFSTPVAGPDDRTETGTGKTAEAPYGATATLSLMPVVASIAKAVSPLSATPGQQVTFTTTVTLPAGILLYDAKVIDQLPDGMVFDATTSITCAPAADCLPSPFPTAAQATYANGGQQRVGWGLGDIPGENGAGEPLPERTITIVYTAHLDDTYTPSPDVLAGDTLTNSALLAWTTTPPTGPTPLPNGTGTAPDPVTIPTDERTDPATATVTVIEPKVVLDKDVERIGDTTACNGAATPGVDPSDPLTAGQDLCDAQPGESYRYTIRVTNTGDAPAYDVAVTDAPDAGLVNVSPAAPTATFSAQDGTLPTEQQCPATQAGPNDDDWTLTDPGMAWTISCLEAGQTATLTYTADIAPSADVTNGQTIVNTADVPAYYGLDATARALNGDERVYGGPGFDVAADTVELDVHLPTLSIVKRTAQDPAFPNSDVAKIGVPFSWRIVVRNTSPYAIAKDLTVADVLPAGWRYDPGTAYIQVGGAVEPAQTAAATGDTLTWSDAAAGFTPPGVLAPGAALTITFDAIPTLDANLTAPNVNGATVTFKDESDATSGGGTPYEALGADPDDPTYVGQPGDVASATIDVPQLGIWKTPDGATVAAGTTTTYQIRVKNLSATRATDVVIGDDLPMTAPLLDYTAGTALSTRPNRFVETDGTVDATDRHLEWTLTFLDPGEEVVITLPVAIAAGAADLTQYVNSASVSSAETPTPLSDTGDVTTGPAPVLVGAKTSDPATWPEQPLPLTEVAPAGGPNPAGLPTQITYRLHYENDAGATKDATNVVLDDGIPANTTYVLGSAAGCGGPHAVASIQYLVGSSYQATEPATGAEVKGVRFVLGTLAHGVTPVDGGDACFAVTVDTPRANGTLIANAALLRHDDNRTGEPLGPVVHVVRSAPILTLVKSHDRARIDLNADPHTINYSLDFANAGDAIATPAWVEDERPPWTTITRISLGDADAYECALDTTAPHSYGACPADLSPVTAVRWTFAALAPGETKTVGFRVTADIPDPDGIPADTVVPNAATFTSKTTADDDSGVVVDGPSGSSNTVETVFVSTPRITLAKTVDPSGTVHTGDVLTYSLAYSSTGSRKAENVVLEDPIPANVEYVAGSAHADAYLVGTTWQATEPADPAAVSALRWTIGTLAVRGSGTKTFKVRVKSVVEIGTVIDNIATIDADELDPLRSEVKSPVDAMPIITVAKSVASSKVVVGKTITWTIHVEVKGDAPADPLIVSDALPSETTFVSADRDGTFARGTVTWNLGRQLPGASFDLTITGRLLTMATKGKLVPNTVVATAPATTGQDVEAESTGSFTPRATVDCTGLRFSPHNLKLDAKRRLTITVRVAGNPIAGAKVTLRGAGVRAKGVTNRSGKVTVTVKPTSVGTITLRGGTAFRCSRRIPVVHDGRGGSLTG